MIYYLPWEIEMGEINKEKDQNGLEYSIFGEQQ